MSKEYKNKRNNQSTENKAIYELNLRGKYRLRVQPVNSFITYELSWLRTADMQKLGTLNMVYFHILEVLPVWNLYVQLHRIFIRK